MVVILGIAGLVLVIVLVAGALLVRRARHAPTPSGSWAVTTPRPRPQASAAREGLGSRIRSLFGEGEPGERGWAELEALLIRADVGPATSARIVRDVRERWSPGADPAGLIADEIATLLDGQDVELHLPRGRLSVVLVVGVNGTGKTTTIGKLAARLGREGRTVALAGSDTFRAAASEQLDVWARRAGAQLVSQARGADPGAVAFDAVRSATAKRLDVLIVDTAGRLHTKTPLMDELAKVRRVVEKAGGTIDETLLVLDATTGQNGIAQAHAFAEAASVTGVALTKMDGTARGGVVLAVRERLGVPVKLLGTGEALEDLQPFEARAFADRLLSS